MNISFQFGQAPTGVKLRAHITILVIRRRRLLGGGGASKQQLENEKVCVQEDLLSTRRGMEADRLSAEQGGFE